MNSIFLEKCIRAAWTTCLLSLLWFGFGAIPGMAQDKPRLTVELEQEEIYQGESVILHVDVYQVQNAKPPSLKAIEEDFVVQWIGERPVSQSSTTIINGRISTHELIRTTFHYRLTPKKVGEITIPELSLKANGYDLKSPPVTLRVIQPEKQDYVIVAAKASRNSVYPTQSFDVQLTVFVKEAPGVPGDPLRPLQKRSPKLIVPWTEDIEGLKTSDRSAWLQGMLADRGYGFLLNDFGMQGAFLLDAPVAAKFDLLTGKVERQGDDGKTYTYYKYELSRRFEATRPGVFTFNPSMVRGTFVVGTRDGELLGKRIAALTDPLEIVVKEVPSPRPHDFIGGVGSYAIRSSVAPSVCRVGDPISLTLKVESDSGNLDRISSPDIGLIPEIVDGFEILDTMPIGQIEGNEKTFTYGLRPKSVDARIPALQFRVFDPEKEEFVPIVSNEVSLRIEEGQYVPIPNATVSSPAIDEKESRNQDGIESSDGSMHPVRDERFSYATWVPAMAASWVMALSVLATAAGLRWKKSHALSGRKNWKAWAEERARLARDQLERGALADSIETLHHALAELLSVHASDRPLHGSQAGDPENVQNSTGLTSAQLVAMSRQQSYPAEWVQRLQSTLQQWDSLRYGAVGSIDPASLQQGIDLLTSGAEMKRGSRSAFRKLASTVGLSVGIVLASLAASLPAKADEGATIENESQVFGNQVQRLQDEVQRGMQSAGTYFHLGNAYFQSADFARAAQAYRIALRFSPTDAATNRNLLQAESKLGLTNSPGDWKWIVRRWLHLNYRPSLLGASWAVVFASILFMVGGLRRRSLLIAISLGVCATAAGVFYLVESTSPVMLVRHSGVILEKIEGRKGMSERAEAASATPLAAGTCVQVVQKTPRWVLVKPDDGSPVWIPNSAIHQEISP